MNKYQKYLIDLCKNDFYYIFNGVKIICLNNDKIEIKQNEDITITKYLLSISNKFIEKVYSVKGESIVEITAKESSLSSKIFDIELDFENRIDALKVLFIDNLADDLILPIVYEEADKEKYYAKKEQEYKDNLLKTADIKVSTGADLVNIYFQPCCDNYVRTEIVLYRDKNMLAKYKVDEDEFFKSINGLAYGKYSFILKQYSKDNIVILETGHIEFNISKLHGIMPRVNRI